MAFYFALLNLSNIDSNKPRRRAMSLNRHKSNGHSPRRTTIAYDSQPHHRAAALAVIAGSTPPKGRRRATETANVKYESNKKFQIIDQGRKVTFEKKQSKKQIAQKQYFLDDPRANTIDALNGNAVRLAMAHRSVADGEPETPGFRNRLLQTSRISYQNADGIHSAGKKLINKAEDEEEINEGYYPVSPTCSNRAHRAQPEHTSQQNVENEIIEHGLHLSAPPRRRTFWKPNGLLRRRSTSDNYKRYGWSFLNPGFRFHEDEIRAASSTTLLESHYPTDENMNIMSAYIYSESLPYNDHNTTCRRIR